MPWLAIPATEGSAAIKNNLANTLQITGIPTIIVLDAKTGNYITDKAREEVMASSSSSDGDAKAKGLNLVETWKKIESVPIEEAAAKRAESVPKRSMLMSLVMHIAKNPIWIFGLIYIYKRFMKYAQTAGEDTPDMIENDGNVNNGQEF
mmetsp:Transcript_19921/g.28808  ORF Transcript_19921/g.28808 Transcript_19921/m.28808 type:complete len:149 (-) Transcript_19921:281-727(-)